MRAPERLRSRSPDPAMAVTSDMPELLAPRVGAGEIALWGGAAALVVALHLGAAWFFQPKPLAEMPAEEAMSAVMIDLAPVAVAPDAVPTETAELLDSTPVETAEIPPETLEAEPLPPEELPPPETVEIEPVESAELAETTPQEVEPLEEVSEVEEIVPDLVEAPLPEVAMAMPAPRPEIVEPKPEPKPKPKPERKKVERRPPPKPAPAAKASAEDAPVRAAPRPTEGSASQGESPARWQSRVVAHINRNKRYPAGESAQGTAAVRFTIDASGRVTSASLSRSSGSSVLDSAAVDIVRRASPVPAPPPAEGRRALTVPINFSRR